MAPALRSNRRLRLSLAHARARRDSGGAVLFIVAMTLAVLAVMGVYGLGATATDIRSAGYMREAAQAQSAAEYSLGLVAESITPQTAAEVVRVMRSGQDNMQATKCRTANPFDASTNAQHRAAQACLSWKESDMVRMSKGINEWQLGDLTDPLDSTFYESSFGNVPNRAHIRVEITNPVDIPPPPGTGLNDRFTFTQVTVTTFVDMKPTSAAPAESLVAGRGRLTIGPYFRQ
jgi:Tfp pilus assembly protein PilX